MQKNNSIKHEGYSAFYLDSSSEVFYDIPQFPSQIRKANLSYCPDYTTSPVHWHNDLEFVYIVDGKMTYNVNGKLIVLTKGNGIFVNSHQLHYGLSPEKKECVFIYAILHSSLLASNSYFYDNFIVPFLADENLPFVHLKKSSPWQNEILSLIEQMYSKREVESSLKLKPQKVLSSENYNSTNVSTHSLFFIQQSFFRIMELLYENNNLSNTKRNTQLDTVRKMATFLFEHYTEKISLDDIANSGACCKSKCSALFQQFMSDSPISYLTKIRLSKSCGLLRTTDKPITEIALDCGFNGSSYFCEIFKKYYKITPQDYRRKFSGEE